MYESKVVIKIKILADIDRESFSPRYTFVHYAIRIDANVENNVTIQRIKMENNHYDFYHANK